MAKGKKQNLSAEELLEQAILADDEQPYEVPTNWIWTKLDNFIDTLSGFPFDSSLFSNKPADGFPLIRIRDIVRGFTETYTSQECSELYHVNTGDLLIGMDGDFNIASWKSEVSLLNQRVCKIKSVNDKALLDKYMFYYLPRQLKEIQDATSSVTVKHLSVKKIEAIALPLPPITEQQRIIDRIESLFAKLDQAKELAQDALDSFDTRKAAILHKAFTGELTAKWRETHGVGMDSWEVNELGDVCSSLQYGTSKKSSDEGKVVVIRMGNLQDGEIDWNNLAYSDDEEDIGKYILQPGDVLFNRTNSPELVGKTSIYRGEYPAIFAGYLIRLKYDNQMNGDYLNYVMNSVRAKEYCNAVKSDGVNQSNINAKKIAAFTLPVPSLEEQQEIVRILNRLFDSEKNANGITDVIDKIEQMKKAILARAFRGELGTNDPSEESALELLNEVVLTQ
ncbi:restriction endonuclease subunit S [Paenibacillus glycanilyticus]|uniref:Type I restriction modification DNA specificity domain-containing protein n=1 Tax=Paenibacillus glycanilyticus TaxID=126569 RepID=A0ABQ6G430_9BACL|nr:restriction endonuclease subunit S [Paenibacillus glycanilyticus]GLX65731.1 hypothetical protein MU1_00750 [Paenibacillus glycanilyticus]